jgi:hypothetical protein
MKMKVFPALVAAAALAAISAWGGPSESGGSPPQDPSAPAAQNASIEQDVKRIRAATERFRALDAAVKAGYPRTVAQCVDNPPAGGMGYHHIHSGLLDARIELERPEILVYERAADGRYALVGVEYAVPLDAWTSDAPPTVMGQKLKPAPALGLWYLHVWVWRENPNGLFADWNPNVECRGDRRVAFRQPSS